jgi:peptide/nickel transport system ATP-binding protein/oligopeptide transport system ATP-binding protein
MSTVSPPAAGNQAAERVARGENPSADTLLDIRGLRTYFHTEEGLVRAVDDVSFQIHVGEALGVVGESGSGKSVTALSVMRIIQTPPGEIIGGEAVFRSDDLLKLPPNAMRRIRGNQIAMIFQDPMTSLNPVMAIGDQICEAVMLHQALKRREAWSVGIEMLRKVRIPLPEERMHAYPFQMSGGMRQRAMIAMALSCHPALLIADEPTTALDVTIQAQILDLIRDLQREEGMEVWMITHDLGVVAETCSRVVVMYAGLVMEEGTVEQIFRDPKHPYTIGLLNCLPKLDEIRTRLTTIPGQPPVLSMLPSGCPFVERCETAKGDSVMQKRCWSDRPGIVAMSDGRKVRCHLAR